MMKLQAVLLLAVALLASLSSAQLNEKIKLVKRSGDSANLPVINEETFASFAKPPADGGP